MRRLTSVLVIILGVLFVLSAIMSVNYLVNSRRILDDQRSLEGRGAASYHVVLFLPEIRDVFLSQLESAFVNAAAQADLALEIRRLPLQQNPTQALSEIEAAIAAHPDGFIMFGSRIPGYQNLINQAVDAGIKVITVVSDVPESRRQVFVGSNSFSQGVLAGKLSVQARRNSGRVGLIINQIDPGADQTHGNLVLSGLARVLKAGIDQRIVAVQVSQSGVLSGEEAAWEMLSRDPGINLLICTSAKDTLGAAQTIVDQNKVGKVVVIGCDNQEEITAYIKKGIIFASILRNPDVLAQDAVQAFVDLSQNKGSSSYLDPGLTALTMEELKTGGTIPENLGVMRK